MDMSDEIGTADCYTVWTSLTWGVGEGVIVETNLYSMIEWTCLI